MYDTQAGARRAPLLFGCGSAALRYGLWNRRFHPFHVCTEKKCGGKLNCDNPVRCGLVSSPGDWLWSSWRFYFLHDASVLRMDRLD